MEMLVGLMLASSPVVVVVGLLLAVERRDRRARAEISRQIALTDALHARLGAVVAPVVRWRRHVWQVSVAVPIEQPALASIVLTIVDEVFGRGAYELRVRGRAPVATMAHTQRAAPAVQELSWT